MLNLGIIEKQMSMLKSTNECYLNKQTFKC